MKKINLLLFLICILFQTSYVTAGNSDEKIDLSPKIKKGDWFDLEFSQFHESQIQNKWDIKPFVKKLSFHVDVIELNNGKINLQFKFERFLQLEQSYSYVDTYYPDLSRDFNFPAVYEQPNFIVEISDTGSIYNWTNSIKDIEYVNVLHQKHQSKRSTGSAIGRSLIKSNEITKLIDVFINEWREKGFNHLPPEKGKINPTYKYWERFDIKKTNILIPANSMFSLKGHKSIQLIQLIPKEDILNNPKSITLNDSQTQHSGYLYQPSEYTIFIDKVEHSFTLFPNDTISIEINEQKEISKFQVQSKFPGNAYYFFDLKNDTTFTKGLRLNQHFLMSEPDFVKLVLSKFNKLSQLLKKHENSMSPQIIHEVTLNSYYWAASQIINYEIFSKKRIDREIPAVKNIFEMLKPQFDYLYNLEFYHEYLSSEFKRAKSDFNFDTPLIFNIENNYFFIRHSLYGYPLYYLSMVELKELIRNSNLSNLQEEINDFFTFCKSPDLLNNFEDTYDKIKLIQPGTSIDSLNLNFPKSKKFIEAQDKYKIIVLHFPNFGTSILNQIIDIYSYHIKEMGFQDKVELLIYSSEEVEILQKYQDRGTTIKVISQDQKLIENDQSTFFDSYMNIQIISPDNKIISSFAKQWEIREILQKHFDSRTQPISQAGNSRLLLVTLASFLAFGFLSWIVIRIRTNQIAKKEAAKRKLSELELRAIRSQMNPHFMFNALNSIQNLVNKNKIEASNIYLSEFAEMMRLVLNNSEKQLVPLEEEIKLIQSYLELEKLRIPFEFEISIDPNIHPEEEEIPGMLIQPFVENAVIHGIAPQKGGEIKVAFTKKNNKICCEITDNGIGISKRSEQRNGNGKAIKMMEERIKIVNAQTTEMLSFEIIDRNEMNETGTMVRIEIPV